MGTSFTLFRLFDIDVRIHWSFLLILVYGAFTYSEGPHSQLFGMLFGIVTILLLFACVTLHEFGHALVAQYFGVRVPNITLLPIGGVASLEKMPDKPSHELIIAIAGPLVNFVIALLLLPILYISFPETGLTGGFSTEAILRQLRQPTALGLLAYLFATNILLGVFNLLPAFPMDGGRILRSLLAMVLPYVRATNIAVFIGRGIAVLFFIMGIFTQDVLTMLVAFFVYVGGGSERAAVASRAALRGYSASDLVKTDGARLYVSESIERVKTLFATTMQVDFPVFDLANRFVGVLRRAQLIQAMQSQAMQSQAPEPRIIELMESAAHLPTCQPNTNLVDALEQMADAGSHVIVVKEGQEFLGLISTEDISQLLQATEGSNHRRGKANEPVM